MRLRFFVFGKENLCRKARGINLSFVKINDRVRKNLPTKKEDANMATTKKITDETIGKYIPESELAESQKIMRGRTLYTINKDFTIVETPTVRCNPSSYSYEALEVFLKNNKELLESYFNDEDNYGIGFYACGYNGNAQQEFAQAWADNGVRVF